MEIGSPVLEKKILEGFLPYMGVACDQNIANKISMPLPKDAPHKISTLIGQAVSEKKIFETVDDDGRRMTTDGRTPDHWYTISSPVSLRLR